jgi:hypothetical protein
MSEKCLSVVDLMKWILVVGGVTPVQTDTV